jgi:hypothetical protein
VRWGLEGFGIIWRMESKLCPKCGAYWDCDCVIETPRRLLSRPTGDDAPQEPTALLAAPGGVCQHDWTEVVGVELDDDASLAEVSVLVCRLCGLYAVEKSA